MDRKAWIVVILCGIGLIANMWWSSEQAKKYAEQQQNQPQVEQTSEEAETNPVITAPGSSAAPAEVVKPESVVEAQEFEIVAETGYGEDKEAERVKYVFTNIGGGLARIEYLDDPSNKHTNGPKIVNENSNFAIGALTFGNDIERGGYEVVAQGERFIEFRGNTFQGMVATKRYELVEATSKEGANYRLTVKVSLELPGEGVITTDSIGMFFGEIGPEIAEEGVQLSGFGWLVDGETDFTSATKFKGGMFSDDRDEISETLTNPTWVAVMNQFYALVLSPTSGLEGDARLIARPVNVTVEGRQPGDAKDVKAVSGYLGLGSVNVAPGTKKDFEFELYAGPKNYEMLKKVGGERQLVMFYDDMPVIGFIAAPFSRLLNWGMHKIQTVSVNYGIAIICITLLIRIVLWPLYAKSQKTMKRMSKLAPMMQEIREKYADDPQKMNMKTMELYRDYGVSPMGGCLPMFLQMPIFFGFYRMLQYAAELRHEGFLWVPDLSQPDTLDHVFGFPINVLPLLMAVTMFIQMKITPKTTDNAQQKIFMFLPFVFLIICYNFASALALYWTTQNIFSIGQTWWASRQPDVELVKKPKKKRPSLAELQKQRAAMSQGRTVDEEPKKPKKRQPRTGG
ncbi:YidC/Oxa1 family insertase periplasmic-domain containing protein [Sulfuriroseicoccus oceanibius]|uniref:Membrane protein insertase YidC n=1 Tax=Sulfuriroseicoccus oceanibius TaxID=2707525 RepID=A0A6B3LB93_9BACT|nr:YidC/Oxa1 family insertase periplasmic-domain containing protein [Sulfuriroseicoccus oceanibius]QQL44195.1 YidC/Oxa1 family insertase periplasmic-domain containing protein [Sulfuriroseicoccus oceanibius]